MTKFKIGDRVKLIAYPVGAQNVGDEGFIKELDFWDDVLFGYTVIYDNIPGEEFCEQEQNLELAQETKVTEFQAGDVVKVLKDRNAFGDDISWRELSGKIVTLKEITDLGYPSSERYDKSFTPWKIEEESYWVRSDDIELVSRKEDHPLVKLTSEMIDWEDALFGEHATDEYGANYKIERVEEDLVSIKIKKSIVWSMEDLIELGSHLFALAEYLETDTVDLSDDGECLECENEHLKDSNERLVSANDAKRERLAKIRELTEV